MEFEDDCARIQKVAALHGYKLSKESARQIWIEYSGNFCASWLVLPLQDDVLWHFIEYFVIKTPSLNNYAEIIGMVFNKLANGYEDGYSKELVVNDILRVLDADTCAEIIRATEHCTKCN